MATIAQKMALRGQSTAGGPTPLTRVALEFPLSVTAVASSDFVVPVPKGARNLTFRTVTDTAFTAVTDAQISIGKTAGGAEYVAATTIKAIGNKIHTLVDAAAADYQGLPQEGINVRIAQSGGSTAVGAAKLYVDYSLPA